MTLPVLKAGDKIGLVAPAGPVNQSNIEAGVRVLQQYGFEVLFSNHLFQKYRYFSGTIRDRIEDIHSFLHNPEVKGIYAVRGGMGSSQLLPEIDFQLWSAQRKLLIGFSDITALQWALWAKVGLPSISGMTLTSQLRLSNPHISLFFDMLSGNRKSIAADDFLDDPLSAARTGETEGLLIGGTLALINSLLGTPYFPELPPFILFLEDINEPLYRLERLLMQLKLAGVLDRVKGLILGHFKDKNEPLEVWSDLAYLFPADLPVVTGFPYGHFENSCPLPVGVSAKMNAQPFRLEWEI
ncbi:MAG: LD-carboxypeptidase [Calditrichia bacterium]